MFDDFNILIDFSEKEYLKNVEFIFNQLETRDPDPRKMQINLTGFLNGKNARMFMEELWKLLDSAQKTTSGIPQELIDKKKEEMKLEVKFNPITGTDTMMKSGVETNINTRYQVTISSTGRTGTYFQLSNTAETMG